MAQTTTRTGAVVEVGVRRWVRQRTPDVEEDIMDVWWMHVFCSLKCKLQCPLNFNGNRWNRSCRYYDRV